MNYKFNLSYLSKYRTELMGVSTLLILLCHSIAYIKMPVVLHYAISFSNIGVDFFLFLSGMGLWYSLSSSTTGMAKWYAGRYTKLLVPYFTVLLFDSSGLNVPPVAETNVPGIAETNVPSVAE